MAKDFDYKTALVKLIGKNQEYILGGDGIKVQVQRRGGFKRGYLLCICYRKCHS